MCIVYVYFVYVLCMSWVGFEYVLTMSWIYVEQNLLLYRDPYSTGICLKAVWGHLCIILGIDLGSCLGHVWVIWEPRLGHFRYGFCNSKRTEIQNTNKIRRFIKPKKSQQKTAPTIIKYPRIPKNPKEANDSKNTKESKDSKNADYSNIFHIFSKHAPKNKQNTKHNHKDQTVTQNSTNTPNSKHKNQNTKNQKQNKTPSKQKTTISNHRKTLKFQTCQKSRNHKQNQNTKNSKSTKTSKHKSNNPKLSQIQKVTNTQIKHIFKKKCLK